MKSKILVKAILFLIAILPGKIYSQPAWTVDPGRYTNNMTVTGVINLNFIESKDINDIVGAFINGECRGVFKPVYQPTVDRYIVYLMIYGNEATGTITFRVYDAGTGIETAIPTTMAFELNKIVGSSEAPYVWSSPTLSNEAELLSFSISNQAGETTINNNNIVLSMPFGSDLSGLVAVFTTSPHALIKVNNTVQTSGTTANNFTSPVLYTVRSADETRLKTYTVTVHFANAIPTDIHLSSMQYDENKGKGTEIGTFTSVDADENSDHTYTLVPGEGDQDNSSFIIAGDKLISDTWPDFESKPSYSIRVKTDDGRGGVFEKQFEIKVIDAKESVANAPNVFTPNNDGINDYWTLENNYTFQNCRLTIFDNIGNIVFESTGYENNWDGTIRGTQLPVGTYYFVLKCPGCRDCKYSGSISLIR
jgi:gliding motility-associated-like protein